MLKLLRFPPHRAPHSSSLAGEVIATTQRFVSCQSTRLEIYEDLGLASTSHKLLQRLVAATKRLRSRVPSSFAFARSRRFVTLRTSKLLYHLTSANFLRMTVSLLRFELQELIDWRQTSSLSHCLLAPSFSPSPSDYPTRDRRRFAKLPESPVNRDYRFSIPLSSQSIDCILSYSFPRNRTLIATIPIMDSIDPTERALLERVESRTRQLREAEAGLREAEEGLELYRREVETARQIAMDLELALAIDRADVVDLTRPRRLNNGWNDQESESEGEDDSEFEDETEIRVDLNQRACVACMDDLNDDDAHRSRCGHKWCRTCVVNRYDMAARSTHLFPAQCCNQPILPDNHELIAAETWAQYFAKKVEVETPNPTFCSKRDCSKFIPLQDISEGQATCVCGHITCAECKADSHNGDCVLDSETEQFLMYAQQQDWQRCVRCRVTVDRIDGCNEISLLTLLSSSNTLYLETSTDPFFCRVRPLRSQVLLCVWQGVEDMPVSSVWARRTAACQAEA